MRLLVVSREIASLRPLWAIVESNPWHVETAASGWDAMERVQSGVAPHLLLLDVPRGDGDSLHVLRWLHRLRPELPLVLLCHAADAGCKKDAIRLGAEDVLVRPFHEEQLELVLHRYLPPHSVDLPAEVSNQHVEALDEDGSFIGTCPLMQRVRAQAELLAQADVPVLIVGEKGSGKETIARLIHRLSVRSGFDFCKVSCAGLPGDLLEAELFGAENHTSAGAGGLIAGKFGLECGSLLLDEVSEMPYQLQARLVGWLQDRSHPASAGDPVANGGVRILASTSANIERALAEKKLHEDLYYRLSAFTVHVPPLRQRKEEITVLLRHVMHQLAKHYGLPARDFSNSVMEACRNYSWPGNLRELEAFVKRYLIAGESEVALGEMHAGRESGAGSPHAASNLRQTDLPGNGASSEEGWKSLKSMIQSVKSEAERNAIGLALTKTAWNRKAAARLLKVSYRTLLYKIDQYHMNSSESFVSPLPAAQFPLAGAGSKDRAS